MLFKCLCGIFLNKRSSAISSRSKIHILFQLLFEISIMIIDYIEGLSSLRYNVKYVYRITLLYFFRFYILC